MKLEGGGVGGIWQEMQREWEMGMYMNGHISWYTYIKFSENKYIKGKDLSCQDLLIKMEFIPSMGFGGTKKKIFMAEGIVHRGLVDA